MNVILLPAGALAVAFFLGALGDWLGGHRRAVQQVQRFEQGHRDPSGVVAIVLLVVLVVAVFRLYIGGSR